MHELGVTQEIVDIICDRAAGAKIKRVVLEIGKLTTLLPDAVRFCFDLCAEGTSAEKARLEILEINGQGRCPSCSEIVVMERPLAVCRCGNSQLDWVAGEELKIKEMEVY